MIKRTIAMVGVLVSLCMSAGAQMFPETISWSATTHNTDDGLVEVVFTGTILDGWHTYSLDDEVSPSSITFEPNDDVLVVDEPVGELTEHTFVIRQTLHVASKTVIKGEIDWRSCLGTECRSPEDWQFEVSLKPARAASGASSNIWALILEAILWGLMMLLTPCVFPMVPMTISFFLKGSGSPAKGRFNASMYGLFIVLLYTVPISVIIGLTWLLGGESVTADIFNWLSTHWLPNTIFFIIFMIFAASFFGAFEITLPSKWTNSADKNADRGGLAGVFFLALTLVLVSFSCTGPIVGTVLIKSTEGEFWAPMVTMLAFSVAFALPFTIFALFPSLLKKLPKSGGWLNSVKVVLGFIEVALGFKFLSTADQTYHWHLLDREIYLAIWIVCFTLLGLYLLGKIRFKHDSPVEYVSVGRLALAIGVFSFVVYLIPGMWGAPLKALSGYMPPIETQDFVVGRYAPTAVPAASVQASSEADDEMLQMPHGLVGYSSIEAGLKASAAQGKPVFVDITGHGCVNCREMEARVWSDPKVLELLRDRFVLVALYTDDKTKLPESEWITTSAGKVLKDVGRVNSYIVRERFGVNAQPNYALLDQNGTLLAPVRGYNLDVQGFVDFLEGALK